MALAVFGRFFPTCVAEGSWLGFGWLLSGLCRWLVARLRRRFLAGLKKVSDWV
jgi:hypothetical protein